MDKSQRVAKYLRFAHHPSVYRSKAGTRLIINDFWNKGLKKDFPQHYKDFYRTWSRGPQTHIHSKPNLAKFEKDEWGEIFPVQNPKITVIYPEEFHNGLWGGEGVIKGRKANKEGRHRSFKIPPGKYWWPDLFEGVIYSEVLDVHLDMVMTMRGARLVDEAKGFDNYILTTPVNEVYALRLLKLKREILLALCDKDNFSSKAHKLGPRIYEKYQQFIVPKEVADWTGLALHEAKKKQMILNSMVREKNIVPDKLKYRQELLHLLRSGYLDDVDFELLDDTQEERGGISVVWTGLKNTLSGKKN